MDFALDEIPDLLNGPLNDEDLYAISEKICVAVLGLDEVVLSKAVVTRERLMLSPQGEIIINTDSQEQSIPKEELYAANSQERKREEMLDNLITEMMKTQPEERPTLDIVSEACKMILQQYQVMADDILRIIHNDCSDSPNASSVINNRKKHLMKVPQIRPRTRSPYQLVSIEDKEGELRDGSLLTDDEPVLETQDGHHEGVEIEETSSEDLGNILDDADIDITVMTDANEDVWDYQHLDVTQEPDTNDAGMAEESVKNISIDISTNGATEGESNTETEVNTKPLESSNADLEPQEYIVESETHPYREESSEETMPLKTENVMPVSQDVFQTMESREDSVQPVINQEVSNPTPDLPTHFKASELWRNAGMRVKSSLNVPSNKGLFGIVKKAEAQGIIKPHVFNRNIAKAVKAIIKKQQKLAELTDVDIPPKETKRDEVSLPPSNISTSMTNILNTENLDFNISTESAPQVLQEQTVSQTTDSSQKKGESKNFVKAKKSAAATSNTTKKNPPLSESRTKVSTNKPFTRTKTSNEKKKEESDRREAEKKTLGSARKDVGKGKVPASRSPLLPKKGASNAAVQNNADVGKKTRSKKNAPDDERGMKPVFPVATTKKNPLNLKNSTVKVNSPHTSGKSNTDKKAVSQSPAASRRKTPAINKSIPVQKPPDKRTVAVNKMETSLPAKQSHAKTPAKASVKSPVKPPVAKKSISPHKPTVRSPAVANKNASTPQTAAKSPVANRRPVNDAKSVSKNTTSPTPTVKSPVTQRKNAVAIKVGGDAAKSPMVQRKETKSSATPKSTPKSPYMTRKAEQTNVKPSTRSTPSIKRKVTEKKAAEKVTPKSAVTPKSTPKSTAEVKAKVRKNSTTEKVLSEQTKDDQEKKLQEEESVKLDQKDREILDIEDKLNSSSDDTVDTCILIPDVEPEKESTHSIINEPEIVPVISIRETGKQKIKPNKTYKQIKSTGKTSKVSPENTESNDETNEIRDPLLAEACSPNSSAELNCANDDDCEAFLADAKSTINYAHNPSQVSGNSDINSEIHSQRSLQKVSLEDMMKVLNFPLEENLLWSLLLQIVDVSTNFNFFSLRPAVIFLNEEGVIELHPKRDVDYQTRSEKDMVFSIGACLWYCADFTLRVDEPPALSKRMEDLLIQITDLEQNLTLFELRQLCGDKSMANLAALYSEFQAKMKGDKSTDATGYTNPLYNNPTVIQPTQISINEEEVIKKSKGIQASSSISLIANRDSKILACGKLNSDKFVVDNNEKKGQSQLINIDADADGEMKFDDKVEASQHTEKDTNDDKYSFSDKPGDQQTCHHLLGMNELKLHMKGLCSGDMNENHQEDTDQQFGTPKTSSPINNSIQNWENSSISPIKISSPDNTFSPGIDLTGNKEQIAHQLPQHRNRRNSLKETLSTLQSEGRIPNESHQALSDIMELLELDIDISDILDHLENRIEVNINRLDEGDNVVNALAGIESNIDFKLLKIEAMKRFASSKELTQVPKQTIKWDATKNKPPRSSLEIFETKSAQGKDDMRKGLYQQLREISRSPLFFETSSIKTGHGNSYSSSDTLDMGPQPDMKPLNSSKIKQSQNDLPDQSYSIPQDNFLEVFQKHWSDAEAADLAACLEASLHSNSRY